VRKEQAARVGRLTGEGNNRGEKCRVRGGKKKLRLILKNAYLPPRRSPQSMPSLVTDCPLTLSHARCGERLRVLSICPNCPDCVRLRELGFCESAEVCKVTDGGALICMLMGVRVAIGRELASHVRVERVAA
jgi:ferrous iron transport protein A